jgi:hypothetical protein
LFISLAVWGKGKGKFKAFPFFLSPLTPPYWVLIICVNEHDFSAFDKFADEIQADIIHTCTNLSKFQV